MKDKNLQRICPRSDKKPVTSIKGFLGKKNFYPTNIGFVIILQYLIYLKPKLCCIFRDNLSLFTCSQSTLSLPISVLQTIRIIFKMPLAYRKQRNLLIAFPGF